MVNGVSHVIQSTLLPDMLNCHYIHKGIIRCQDGVVNGEVVFDGSKNDSKLIILDDEGGELLHSDCLQWGFSITLWSNSLSIVGDGDHGVDQLPLFQDGLD
jgi:hypothetical protein